MMLSSLIEPLFEIRLFEVLFDVSGNIFFPILVFYVCGITLIMILIFLLLSCVDVFGKEKLSLRESVPSNFQMCFIALFSHISIAMLIYFALESAT